MSTHNLCFCGELMKIILQLSSDTHLIFSTGYICRVFSVSKSLVVYFVFWNNGMDSRELSLLHWVVGRVVCREQSSLILIDPDQTKNICKICIVHPAKVVQLRWNQSSSIVIELKIDGQRMLRLHVKIVLILAAWLAEKCSKTYKMKMIFHFKLNQQHFDSFSLTLHTHYEFNHASVKYYFLCLHHKVSALNRLKF